MHKLQIYVIHDYTDEKFDLDFEFLRTILSGMVT